jgi:hypothetical protein
VTHRARANGHGLLYLLSVKMFPPLDIPEWTENGNKTCEFALWDCGAEKRRVAVLFAVCALNLQQWKNKE